MQELQECIGACRASASPPEERHHIGGGQPVSPEHSPEPPGAQIIGNVPFGTHHDTQPREGPRSHRLSVVARQGGSHPYGSRLSMTIKETPQRHILIVLSKRETYVRGQFQRTGWLPPCLEVRRGCAREALIGRQWYHNQRGVLQLADVNDEVPVALIRYGRAIGQGERDGHIGIAASGRPLRPVRCSVGRTLRAPRFASAR